MQINRFISNIINFIFGLITIFVLISLIQYKNGTIDLINNMPMQNWVIFLISVIILIGLISILKLYRRRVQIESYKMVKILVILSIVVLVIQVVIAYQIYFYTGWDASAVRNAAFYFIEHPDKIKEYFGYYFSYHTNQTTITVLIGLIMRFLHFMGIKNVYFGAIMFSVLSVNLSILLVSLVMNKLILNKFTVIFGFALCTFLCSFSPWITIPYSDTYMMLFASFAFYQYININENKYNIIRWCLIFISIFLGSLIKPQTLIMGIAIFLYEFTYKRKNTIKQEILRVFYLLLIVSISYFLSIKVQEQVVRIGSFDQNPDLAFTLPHYLMVGLNYESYGTYVAEDAEISYGMFTVEERENKNFEVIRERINNLNKKGWFEFLLNKSVINFNDGSFAWGREGNFYQEVFHKDNLLANILRSYFYHEGKLFDVFLITKQFMWIIVLSLVSCSIFFRKKDVETFVQIVTIGIILFNMIFEARARYLFAYVPYLIVISTLSMNHIIEFDFSVLKKKLINTNKLL